MSRSPAASRRNLPDGRAICGGPRSWGKPLVWPREGRLCQEGVDENISSHELEAAVLAHPAIVEGAAVAVKSDIAADDLKIVAVLQAGAVLTLYVEEMDYYFLKTVIPSRKATRDYLETGDPDDTA